MLFILKLFFHLIFFCFFFQGYGDHRDLHKEYRRQRQMCIRDSINAEYMGKIDYKFKKEIKIDWFKKKINEVFATIKELVNHEIGSKGIPLPSVKGVDYHDIVQYVKTGYIEIGVNPKFHLTAAEEDEEEQ
eukprot:TRINITY_DN59943_c0_g1_i1.p2 TRINITY_DN59943_c0_g1~~TRINITY_DN59943_c0_g1_i1.p2  ORF type:complete len:131 (+),score=31.06 TRINITY_DN59943_c0_g1_i1:64-456(+)